MGRSEPTGLLLMTKKPEERMGKLTEQLLPCPFCGGEAGFECIGDGFSTWSVGCMNNDIDCIGYQMLAHFNRQCEAAAAWNKRPSNPLVPLLTLFVSHYEPWMEKHSDDTPSVTYAKHTIGDIKKARAALIKTEAVK